MCACGHWVAEHSGRRKALHSSQPDGPQPRKIHRRTETYCTYCTWRHAWKIITTEGSGCPHNTEKSEHVFYSGLTAWMWINLVCFQEIIQLKVKIVILYSPSNMTIFSAGPKNRRLSESQRFILWNWWWAGAVTVRSSKTEKHNKCTNKCILCIFYFAVTMHSHTSH